MPSVKVLDLELTKGLPAIWGLEDCREVRALLRQEGRLIGWVTIPANGQPALTPEYLYQRILEQLDWRLTAALLSPEVFPVGTRQASSHPMSVVVCTRDRPVLLAGCLDALFALDYPEYEIIVVDNAPQDDSTHRLVKEKQVRYIREDRPGLNWARNRGIAEARHDLIAFTDDDARPDSRWLHGLARAFDHSDVDAVTGFVAPLELKTPAQVYFEDVYGGMGKGFRRTVFSEAHLSERQLLWASRFGVGANMAFRRDLFDRIGLFDVALDVGTATRGGGDIEFFHRTVARGHTLVYEPQALVWHRHRPDLYALKDQLYANGRSFGAYLLTCLRNGTVSRRAVWRFVVRDWFMGWIVRRLWRPGAHKRRLVITEVRGMMSSPRAYRKAQTDAGVARTVGPPAAPAAALQEPLLNNART